MQRSLKSLTTAFVYLPHVRSASILHYATRCSYVDCGSEGAVPSVLAEMWVGESACNWFCSKLAE